ncbi:hypothetical protein ACTZWW_08495 [Salinarimonas sp. NSM]|uniref:hypothetical protein n=1 Tax=Salinarimonas sp. NSM TaxID=3458003 RepID=UPI004037123F
MTRGEEMISEFDSALAALEHLQLQHYSDADVRHIVERLGSKVERFFKSAIFPGSATTETFDVLINRLKSIGISKAHRGRLHALRELYNLAKHDPSQAIRLKNTMHSVLEARQSIQELVDFKIGMTAERIETVVSRFLWISAYDVYHAGVSEVYVSLPLTKEVFATHLDVFWIKGLEWDELKAELLETGSFFYGSEHFDPEVYDRFKEGDFINAGVWDGEYRNLIQIMSKYDDRPTAGQLLPFLRRDHNYVAVLTAIGLAGVDVARAASSSLTKDALEAAILDRADQVYAMPSEQPWVKKAADDLAELIVQLPFASWPQISGPFWNLWNPKPLTTAATLRKEAQRYVIYDATRIVIV